MKSVNPVVWFEIYVDDLQRAKKFYEAALGVELTTMPVPGDDPIEMLFFPGDMGPNASGALVKMPGVKAGGNSTLVYFSCEECEVAEKSVAKAGGKIMKPKMSIGEHGFISLCEDTEGNVFGLHMTPVTAEC